MAKRYVIIHDDEREIIAAENSSAILTFINENDPTFIGTVETDDADEAEITGVFEKEAVRFVSLDWDKYAEGLGRTKWPEMAKSEDAAMTPAEHLADKGV